VTAQSPAVEQKSSSAGLSAASGAVLLWSIGNVLVVSVPMGGLQIAFWRMVLGAVVYTAVVYLRGSRLTKAMLRRVAPAGAVISIEIAFFFAAVRETSVANATVIGALTPLVLLVVAQRQFAERITGMLVVATVVATSGVGLVVAGSTQTLGWKPWGDAMAVIAMVLFAAYFVLVKRARASVPILEFQACLWIAGAVALLPAAVFETRGLDFPSLEQWGWLCLVLLIPGTGHLLMNWSHQHVRLVITSMLTLAGPVLSTTGAFFVLDQNVKPVQIVGIIVVLGSLALVVRREAQLGAD
jgi:drug/metabolite transporter (DMT)-like permease